jgi:archaellum component FlaG (FlaF/FlaG flagellin family)
VAAAGAVLVLAALAGCSSEDVTGEPEDIGTLVQVLGDGSECVDDPEAGEVTFRFHLANSGGDERTVTVTPVMVAVGGERVGSALESLKITVPGNGEADGELTVDAAPDDLEGCSVRIDSEEPVPVAQWTAASPGSPPGPILA